MDLQVPVSAGPVPEGFEPEAGRHQRVPLGHGRLVAPAESGRAGSQRDGGLRWGGWLYPPLPHRPRLHWSGLPSVAQSRCFGLHLYLCAVLLLNLPSLTLAALAFTVISELSPF